jgi:hypothetical protein
MDVLEATHGMLAPRPAYAFAAPLALSLAVAACGADPAPGVYRDAMVAFHTDPVPPSWRPVRVSNADLVFRDTAHEASVLVNGRCIPEDGDAPLPTLTEHLVMGTTARDYLLEETIPFDSREARHTVLKAKLDGVLMAYDIYVMKKDGCVYDLVYVGDPASMQGGTAIFEKFALSFHTLAPGS